MSPRLEALAPEPSPHDLIGSRLGAYRVLGRLGAGGMGEVYEVEHQELGRRFALKVLRAHLKGDQETLARFHREPRAVAKLVSEHVVSIVDCGELPDTTPYFVMERLHGSDLRRLLNEQGVLPVARVAHLGVDACRGLACAHRAGLVHRDLKPENLFLTTRDDGQDLCKLLDFGVVKSAQDNTTRPGALLGTTRYMAPEQLGLDQPVSPRSDLFALGVILYECLTGRSPFEGDTVERVLFKIMAEQETPIAELRPEVPQGFAELVSRALCKKPEGRPENALAFAEALLPYTRAATASRGFSSWQLQVADGGLTPGSARDLTPRTTDRDALAAARSVVSAPGGARGASHRALFGLTFGLIFGAGAGFLVSRRVPVESNARRVAAAATAAARSISASPPNPVAPSPAASAPSAEVTRAEARAAPSATTDANPNARSGKRKPVTAGAGTVTPAAPAARFDPHNPYAP